MSMLKYIAACQVGNRPGRLEPRILKRRRHGYYGCYSESAFLERAIGVVQVMWAKPGSPLGIVRSVK